MIIFTFWTRVVDNPKRGESNKCSSIRSQVSFSRRSNISNLEATGGYVQSLPSGPRN